MHFWIDKPAGRCYGFNGRRYPTMSFPKANFGQHRRCGNLDVARLQMVTPVHRFPSTNNSGNCAGPSNPSCIRPITTITQNINDNGNSSIYNEQEISNSNANSFGNNQEILSRSTNTANRLLNFSELDDTEMAGYRLRCSVWIIFVLATGFVVAAKFYFDHQGAGLEVLIFCGLLVTLLMSGCFYSIICRRTQNNYQQETQTEPIATLTVTNTILNDNIRQVSMPAISNPPPPPYHIAILIPPLTLQDEAPPPAYDKIMQ